jgi:hypothetical protein
MTALTTTNTTISIGSVVLNSVDSNGVKWVVDQGGFSGWGTPAPTIQVVGKPRQPGAWAGLSYDKERYLAVQGYISAPTPVLLNQALDLLYASVTLAATPLTVAEAGFTRSMLVRRAGMVDPTRVTSTYARYGFQVVATDGRKLGAQLTGMTLLPATSGGVTVPFTVPFTISSTVVSGQVSFTNPGNVSGPVTLRLDGPLTGPVVTHTSSTTTTALVFSSSLVLGAGEFLLVNMDAHTALANGQTSRSGYITSRGWSLFDPGVNTWSFTASGYNAASQLTVFATPAWS